LVILVVFNLFANSFNFAVDSDDILEHHILRTGTTLFEKHDFSLELFQLVLILIDQFLELFHH